MRSKARARKLPKSRSLPAGGRSPADLAGERGGGPRSGGGEAWPAGWGGGDPEDGEEITSAAVLAGDEPAGLEEARGVWPELFLCCVCGVVRPPPRSLGLFFLLLRTPHDLGGGSPLRRFRGDQGWQRRKEGAILKGGAEKRKLAAKLNLATFSRSLARSPPPFPKSFPSSCEIF